MSALWTSRWIGWLTLRLLSSGPPRSWSTPLGSSRRRTHRHPSNLYVCSSLIHAPLNVVAPFTDTHHPVYVAEIFYIATLALTKISLVCMYSRIFWAYLPFRLACYGALTFIILPSAAIIVSTILSCQPIPYFWDRDIPNGSCIDLAALAYANSAFAAAQDALLIVLPICMLWSLNMSRKKKMLIAAMFGVGSVGLIATIIRLRTLHVYGDLSDPTWDYGPVIYWTAIEVAAGIIASCMPAVRKLLEHCFGVFHIGTALPQSGSDKPGPHQPRGQHILLEERRRGGGARDPMALTDLETWKDDDAWDESGQYGLTSPGGGVSAPKMMHVGRILRIEAREMDEADEAQMGRGL